ncbi:MAG: tetratricopeptide repeat protein [Bacteroidales bacterium]|nr:tetratricopeptide repeat protein [Bacteroidales bacterium]
MATKEKTKAEVRQENAVEQLSRTEQFYEENKKWIWGVIIAILVIWLGALAYNRYIYQPKCAEAQEQCFPAEKSFAAEEWDLALNGDGNVLGFAQVIEEYGSKAGKAVYLYAGICELRLGNYEEAISYLSKYNGREPILKARAIACQADAYVALENYSKAVSLYKKAVALSDNDLVAPILFKEGMAEKALGNKAAALKCFESIKADHPQSIEAYDIDRYIAEVSE